MTQLFEAESLKGLFCFWRRHKEQRSFSAAGPVKHPQRRSAPATLADRGSLPGLRAEAEPRGAPLGARRGNRPDQLLYAPLRATSRIRRHVGRHARRLQRR